MPLINKRTIKNAITPNNSSNIYNITKDDLSGELKKFPIGVVVRMLEETELQGNKPDVKVFQNSKSLGKKRNGFDWDETEAGNRFWLDIIIYCEFDKFYERYPEYKKYDAR